MKRFLLFSICIGLWAFSPVYAEVIYVSGDVSGTWSADTVIVTGEVRVPPGETLIIEPGVKVLFQPPCKFIVDSTALLLAVGTQADSILFDELYPDSSWYGIRLLGASDDSRLEYCYITHGWAYYVPQADSVGGGIYCRRSSPTIQNCLIEDCTALYGGAIACCDSSDPTIQDCTIEDCWAIFGGGIACCHNSSPSIVHNTITGSGDPGGYGVGGGITCIYNSNPLISENTISGNGAHMGGGGINCYASNPTIDGNTISGNSTCGMSGGGGINCSQCAPTISNNVITGNVSGMGGGICCFEANPLIIGNTISEHLWADCGGGICCWTASPTISNNLILDNASGYGGGIFCEYDSNPLINNNVITGDSAYAGGGIYCANNSNSTIRNNTICDNSSWESGGGISCTDASPQIMNCILWGNYPFEIYLEGSSNPPVNYCDVQDTLWPGEGNISADPLFEAGPLSDYQLSPNSPCVDAGDPDPEYDDPEDPINPGYAFWPSLGTVRNDMGAYGGPAAIDWIIEAVDEKPGAGSRPSICRLHQNFPNPFNATTTIRFDLPAAGWVKLEVFDVAGRFVGARSPRPYIEGWRDRGTHEITFDGSDLASGIYIYRLSSGDFTASGKMLLLK